MRISFVGNNFIMKRKLFYITTALIFGASQLQAQWHLEHPSPSAPIENLQVFGNDTLYATSHWDHAMLLKSTNGGTTVDTIDFLNLSAIKSHFISKEVGFVAGLQPFNSGNTVFKTEDGGATWQELNFAIDGGAFYYQIHFANADTGFVSIGGALYRTLDGGLTFVEQTLIADPNYISNIHFLNAQVGFVSLVRTQTDGEMYRDLIFKTLDGGASWTQVYSEQPEQQLVFMYNGISSMQFVNNQLGFAVANGVPSKLLKTTNGGASWNTMPNTLLNEFASLSDVHFISDQVGYIAMGQNIFKTSNGGQSWHPQSFHPHGDYYIGSVEMVNENVGYVSGHGIFSTSNGGGLSIGATKKNDLGIKLYPNPTAEDLFVEIPNNILVEKMQLIDVSGKVIQMIKGSQTKITTRALAKGNYWLSIQTNKGNSSIPFVVQ